MLPILHRRGTVAVGDAAILRCAACNYNARPTARPQHFLFPGRIAGIHGERN
ncbi:hypothetical protein CTRI78_v006073 [Colletotrichum trifolii]|uniref:Uncharacterized protein n=1 Tax=Colletotrichum trifolii TaxID=5466 RepID=A0A4R8RDA8_COLTR|nr:hypothetical protein CTRI78_v006073 [Colletotrichum trifolii]